LPNSEDGRVGDTILEDIHARSICLKAKAMQKSNVTILFDRLEPVQLAEIDTTVVNLL
jgi:hypothetical protein